MVQLYSKIETFMEILTKLFESLKSIWFLILSLLALIVYLIDILNECIRL